MLSCRRGVLALALVLALASRTAAQELSSVAPEPAQDQQEKPAPPPEGTGWTTLVKDTGRDFALFPQRRSTWVFLAGGGALALAVHPADDYVESHIVGNDAANKFFAVGKVIGSAYFQAGSAVGLWIVGRYVLPPQPNGSRTNKVSHLGFDLMRTQIVTQAIVNGIKVSVRRDRPTGECCAFPSGHAASAFAAASVLERHLGYRASWPALVAASYIATSRLVDNRHFLSDVVFGAAVGEAAGWTVVGRHGRSQYALQPIPIRGGMMVALVRTAD
ncbi:MAG TPA: phosphatase PAP2 family protein [Vicinamibacterales bacterium]|nr:phosphatase PAP2 family protein [Vicinamibacterales bacterium]